MDPFSKVIHEHALQRVSKIFNIAIDSLKPENQFGKELKCSFVSDFKHNELDRIDHDIRDVADRQITKELSTGNLTIRSVEDYCNHMIRCYKTKPKDVEIVLGIAPSS